MESITNGMIESIICNPFAPLLCQLLAVESCIINTNKSKNTNTNYQWNDRVHYMLSICTVTLLAVDLHLKVAS